MPLNEIDCLMRVDSGGVIINLGAKKAIPSQLDEWLRTPVGSIYGLPEWGHPLADFRHEPTDETVAVFIENKIVSKLRNDLPNVAISGIRCVPNSSEIDMYNIIFLLPTGEYSIGLQKEK
ncbi:MAG: hypothetical protein ACRC6N_11130 [Plesiomonas sp.]|uniref:hypothetical protein n=1 Tax=Plesiomonas sp. TaxID=2486279 RepID=UPI003F4073AF